MYIMLSMGKLANFIGEMITTNVNIPRLSEVQEEEGGDSKSEGISLAGHANQSEMAILQKE